MLFIRSDHFSFVRQGVPSLFIKSGFKTGDPAKDGSAINAAYRRDVYHKPNDDMSQAFDFEAGAAHAQPQLPDRLAGGAGDGAAGLESRRLLRRAVREGRARGDDGRRRRRTDNAVQVGRRPADLTVRTYATSKRSRCITLVHAAAKSRTNFSLASSQA